MHASRGLFFYTFISPKGSGWKRVDGKLKHVSVSPSSYVWGVNSGGAIYYRQGIGASSKAGTGWKRISGDLLQISAGKSGVWGVNPLHHIFYRVGTFGDNGSQGVRWHKVRIHTAGNWVDVRIQQGTGLIGVGGGEGVNPLHHIFYRVGTFGNNGYEGVRWQITGFIGVG